MTNITRKNMNVRNGYFSALAAAVTSIFLLTSCQAMNEAGIGKQEIGTLGGAVGGAILGSNIGKGKGNVAAIAAGTLLGAYVGKEIGASLDRADMAYYNKTSQYALEKAQTNSTATWKNPDSGHSGTITPTKTYQTASGQYCREFEQSINIGGKTERAYGRACREEDGVWRIVN